MTLIDETMLLEDAAPLRLQTATVQSAGKLRALRKTLRETSHHLNASADEARLSWLATRQEIKHAQAYSNTLILLAWQSHDLVGELHMRASPLARLRHDMRLALGVHPAHQGRGIGQALLKRGIRWAAENPMITRVSLSVHSNNAHAIRLYENLGFVIEGRRKGAIRANPGQDGDQAIDELLMGLYLVAA